MLLAFNKGGPTDSEGYGKDYAKKENKRRLKEEGKKKPLTLS